MRGAAVVIACLLATVLVPTDAVPASATQAVTLATPVVSTRTVVFSGTAPASAKVRIKRSTARGWIAVAATRADKVGRFRVTTIKPTTTWQVRATVNGLVSEIRVVNPTAADPPPTGPADTPQAVQPVQEPTTQPTQEPTAQPTQEPTAQPTQEPTVQPTQEPTVQPTQEPTVQPTQEPTAQPTQEPTVQPTEEPTVPPASDACGVQPVKSDGSLWSCTFDDEFDGTTLDPTKWSVGTTAVSGMTTGNMDCYVDDPQTVFVSDGALVLNARRQLDPFQCATPSGSATATSTGASVTSRTHFSQAYGRFEFRAKFPDVGNAPGAHSALWMYPQTLSYGAWPASGEIDVAEWFSNRPTKVFPSLHYTGEDPLLRTGYNCVMSTSTTEFHTYAVEWSPSEMKFYYDDQLCFTHAWTPSNVLAPQPFDKPFNLVMTEAWGSLLNAPTDATPTSAPMVVDWVRAWQ